MAEPGDGVVRRGERDLARRSGAGQDDDMRASAPLEHTPSGRIPFEAPPPRVRPAIRPEDRDLLASDDEPVDALGDTDRDGSSSGRIPAASSSRRIRIRSASARPSSAEDRRTASGRLAPSSPPQRIPHPRAVSGPPRSRGSSQDPSASGAERRRLRVSTSQSLPAAASGEISLDDAYSDQPIIVVDDAEFPAHDLFGGAASHGLSRAVRVRFDTMAVVGILGMVMLTVAFLVGRQTSGELDAAVIARADAAPSRSLALSIGAPGAPVAAPPPAAHVPLPASAGAAPAPAASAPSAAAPPTASVAENPKWSIMVMRSRRDRADEVKAFLEQQGFRVYLQHLDARATNVRVGGYASTSAPEATRDLQAIRALRFGSTPLADAYFVPWKAGL